MSKTTQAPFKDGDKVIVELTITDTDKAYFFLIGSLLNKVDTSEQGISIQLVSAWEDLYKKGMSNKLKQDVTELLEKQKQEVEDLIYERKH